jgi:parallel beta-helix repeat protein
LGEASAEVDEICEIVAEERVRKEDVLCSADIKHFVRAIVLGLAGAVLCSADIYVAQEPVGRITGDRCADAFAASWFNDAGNWGPGPMHIGSGTIVHLCGSISTNLIVRGAGSSEAPVTILFEPNSRLSREAGGPFLTMSGTSFIVVDGGANGIIENTAAGSSWQNVSSQGIVAYDCTGCEVKNLTIQNLYVHSGSNSEIDQTQSNCIVYSGDNFRIHDNILHDAGWCIYIQGQAVNNRIYNNNIYNVDHAIITSPTGHGANAGPLYIYGNHIHDYANWDTDSNTYHHDGVHCYTVPDPFPQFPGLPPVSGAHWAGLWLYNNLFDGDVGQNATSHIFLEPGSQTDGTATPCMDSSSLVHLFGNVLVNGTTLNGTIDLGVEPGHPLTTPVDFFNNTVIGSDAAEGRGVVFENVQYVKAMNNILGGANKLWDGVSSPNTDYNGYVNCPNNISYNCWPVAGGTNDFDTWRQISSSDTHGQNSQSNFGGVNSVTGALASDSLMVGAGCNLEGAVSGWPQEQQNAILTDRNGVTRGEQSWDIGALSSHGSSRHNRYLLPQPALPR